MIFKDILPKPKLDMMFICDALCDLVPFTQSKKREKHQWRSVTFSTTVLHGCLSRFLNWANGTKSRKVSHMLFKTPYGQRTNQFLQSESFIVLNYLVGSAWQKLKWKYN